MELAADGIPVDLPVQEDETAERQDQIDDSKPFMESAASAGAGEDPLTFPSVLHFLHREWRRFERERNMWELEKAELKVSATFLFALWNDEQFSCFRTRC